LIAITEYQMWVLALIWSANTETNRLAMLSEEAEGADVPRHRTGWSTSRKRLKACGAIHFYRQIWLSTVCAIFSGGFLRKPPLEIVFLDVVSYENRQ
jgi:hypothetical protein